MDRRSRSIESPRRHRNGGMSGTGAGSRRDYRRYSRSRSRSRNRSREREYQRRRSRSRERIPHYRRGASGEKDLYRDIINDDHLEDNYHSNHHRTLSGSGGRKNDDDFLDDRERFWSERQRDKGRDYERDFRDRDRDFEKERDRRDYRHSRQTRHCSPKERDREDGSDESEEDSYQNYSNCIPSNTIIAFSLQAHITEADITSTLIQYGLAATSVRLIRNRRTGASRGFAFVEFNTVDEATHWMELTQGMILLPDQTRALLEYSHSKDSAKIVKTGPLTDWFCGKCGIFNFKRRDNCFKCSASREESGKGGEGCSEISNILTKKIMLRNLDALTNEEVVLTAMQQHVPDLAKRISKILVSRDQLTQTSRGICFLHFDSLVDSMNVHNALAGMEPPLKIDNREVLVNYCIDHENREIVPKSSSRPINDIASASSSSVGPLTAAEMAATLGSGNVKTTASYTIADVPRLAEYSAAMYAQTPEEHAHFLKYYTEYYIGEITKGQFSNLPTAKQVSETSANSGAAVALSAIQRKQKKMSSIETTATQAAAAAAAAAAAVKAALAAAQTVVTPKGNDGKTYPPPDVTLYQYDETSGYYYDPSTGLYYDAHSQYYYNNETGAYLYWDQRKSTYVLATPAAAAATVKDVVKAETGDDVLKSATTTNDDDNKKESKKDGKHDKVKVAKKIVKDMEKWAKQLNQKKDYTVVATPQPILPLKGDDALVTRAMHVASTNSYADVGFSILEKKERSKLSDFVNAPVTNKLVSAYGSDSDEDQAVSTPAPKSMASGTLQPAGGEVSEKDYVDFQKLTCLLCKRAFQSLEILTKHLKMSNLHKENLQKYNLARGAANTDSDGQSSSALSYRDRAKERRLKYGESDPPPPNRSRERFEKEIKNLTANSRSQEVPSAPIGTNNVGNRLLQKMGWSEGQGLGRKNQGRTNIIEADARTSTAGLGNRSTGIGPGDDYKTYIKKMMKSRYESV